MNNSHGTINNGACINNEEGFINNSSELLIIERLITLTDQ